MKAVPLEDVAELNPRLAKKLSANDEVAFVPMAALSAETATVSAEEIRTYADVAKGYTPFASGDVLVAKITPCFENGKIAQTILSKPIGFGSTEFHVVRPRPGKLDGRYAHHFLRLERVRNAGERRMTGSGGQRRVPENYLAKLQIPLPPLTEQRRIAAVLDKADELRAKRRAALAELDTLTQSIFLEMFGDPATNSKGLPTISLGRLGNWASGGTPPRGRGEYFSGDVPWFSSGELEKMFVSESKERISELALEQTTAKLVPKGALMLGMYDTAALKASIAGVACSCNQAIAFATVDAAIAHTIFVYFAIVIGREHFRRLQRGVRQKNLNLTMVREISIPKPPLTLQHDFARRVAAVEDLKSKHATTLAELDALFASLQHRAFRGEL